MVPEYQAEDRPDEPESENEVVDESEVERTRTLELQFFDDDPFADDGDLDYEAEPSF